MSGEPLGDLDARIRAHLDAARASGDRMDARLAARRQRLEREVERQCEWDAFRREHQHELDQQLTAEAVEISDDLELWLAQHTKLRARWRAMDARWAAVRRRTYQSGSGTGGDLPDFPISVSGVPALPLPIEPPATGGFSPGARLAA